MPTARLTRITDTLVRLEHHPEGRFVDSPSLFASRRDRAWEVVEAEAHGPPVVLRTGAFELVYTPDGRGFHEGNLRVRIRKGSGEVEWRPGMSSRGNLGGTTETLDTAVEAVPLGDGVLSREGWFLLDDSRRHLVVGEGEGAWVAARPGGGMDWYLFAYGDDFRAAMRSLGEIAGRVPMPRKVMLGSWYSRYWPYDQEEFLRLIREYDEHGFPLDVLVLDMDWHREGWCGWSWNRTLLPNAEAMLRVMHARGVSVTLNLHPYAGVGPHEDAYPAFMRALGRDAASGETVSYDAADRAYQGALFAEVHAPLEREGVDFWWLDWQQGTFARSIPDLPNLAWLNRLYFEHTQREGTRGASFSRWGGWGDHRHPIHFSGDAHAGWAMLAFQVGMTATAGNAGCFFWSHDIGGHFGPRNEELVTRWVQFGAASPVLRLHSTCALNLDRRPWLCAPRFVRAQRAAFERRSAVFPEIYTGVRRANEEMIPLVRAMYHDHARHERAYHVPTQYMLGASLLAAPIVTPGIGKRHVATRGVWFPPVDHAGWFEWETGERFAPGREGTDAIVAATIDESPLFVAGGTPVATQAVTLRMGTTPLHEVVIVCYPGEPGRAGRGEVYEDDGRSRGHERGEFAKTPMEATWSEVAGGRMAVDLRIGPRVGSFPGEPASSLCVVELRGVSRIVEATRAGGEVRVEHAGDRARLALGEIPRGGEGLAARVVMETADHGAAALARRASRLREALGQGANGWKDPLDALEAMARRGERVPGTLWEIATGLGVRADTQGVHVIGGGPGSGIGRRARLELADLIGGSVTLHFAGMVDLVEVSRAMVRGPLAALEEPPLGLVSRRRATLEFEIGTRRVSAEWELERRARHLTRWRVVGPFDFDPSRRLEAQPQEVERVGSDRERWYETGGKWLGWMPAVVAGDGKTINVWQSMGGRAKVAYAVTHVRSRDSQGMRLAVEALEGVEAWVNGEKVASVSALGNVPTTVEAEVELRAGWNRLMLKVATDSGWWFFRSRLEGAAMVEEAMDV